MVLFLFSVVYLSRVLNPPNQKRVRKSTTGDLDKKPKDHLWLLGHLWRIATRYVPFLCFCGSFGSLLPRELVGDQRRRSNRPGSVRREPLGLEPTNNKP